MALTLVVRSGPRGASAERGELSLTFDSPRLVIGRGDGADFRLPDPSVSHRHASLRARGAEYVLIDENSTNGTFLGRVMLAAQSPRVVKSGELVRVGRVWLEVRIEAALPTSAPPAARRLAIELVSRSLAEQGEEVRPLVRVASGPDAGKELRVADSSKRYVLGRAKDADVPLEDPDASRRHLEISSRGDQVWIVDLGSKGGVLIDDVPLGPEGSAWRPGQVVSVGANRFALEHAAAEALAELERSPDEKMARDEEVPPPGEPAEEEAAKDAPPDQDPASAPPSKPSTPERDDLVAKPAETGGWSLTDGAVLVLAMGVLLISVAGLVWFLGR